MDQNHIIKLNQKKSKDFFYKYSGSNYHRKTKTETNLNDENSKLKSKMNLKSLRIQNSKISLIPENNSQNIQKINSVRPLNSSSYSKLDIFPKSKNENGKNNFPNQQLSLQSNNNNNKQYINIHNNKRHTFEYSDKDKDIPIKKNKSNTSLSNTQQLKKNQSIDYIKNRNQNDKYQKNNIIKISQKKEYLDLNKIIKKEKKIISNKLNSSKSTSIFLKQYNKQSITTNKVNKYKYLNSYSSKYTDYLFDNSEMKNSSLNISYGAMTNCISFSDQHKNIQKFNSFNSSISATNILLDKKNKKTSVFGQYYIDIDLSLNNTKEKKSLINKRLLKKSINLDESIQKDLKISTKLNMYNSPKERNKKSNTKNIIDLRNNFNFTNYLSKKSNFTSREKIPNIISAQKKKLEFQKKNKTTKNKYIPYNTNKIVHINDYQNLYLLNNNNSIKKKNNCNLVGSKLKKSNILSKKELFYSNDSKMWKDYINFQKNTKNISQTPKNKDEYGINFKTEKIPKNYIDLNNNCLTENRNKNLLRTENIEFNYLNKKINRNFNKRNILSQQNILTSKKDKDNFLNDFNSIENNLLKISLSNTNRKNNNNSLKNTTNKENTQESVTINDTKSKKSKYIDPNLKDVNLIDSLSNLDNNCFNLSNLVNKSNKSNTHNKKYNGIQIIVSNTDSGKKKLSISPSNNKVNIIQYNGIGTNKKINKININIDEYNSKSYLNNKNNLNESKMINFTEYNKELVNNYNNNSKESHTLLKSISFCKKINNPVKLYPKKKDTKINKAFYIPSYVKRIYMPNQNSNNKIRKFNNTVEIKQNNKVNNNINTNFNRKYKNNNIININNNTSNVNVLNVKNSSINICFEKKEKYKDLSPEKNINYSTTVNNAHRNNKINNIANEDNYQIERNKNTKNNNKLKSNTNEDNLSLYTKISNSSIKNNNLNIKINDKIVRNGKKINFNIKNNTQQICVNNSETNIFKKMKINDKVLSERENNIKIDFNNFKNNIDININKISLNSARNENLFNTENIDKPKKIPIIKENNFKRISVPALSAKNSIIVLNKKISNGVYVKPTCVLSKSKSKSKNKFNSEKKSKIENKTKNNNTNTNNKSNSKISKSLNPENTLNYTPPYKNSFQAKYNSSLKASQTKLKMCKSARSLYKNSIEKKKINKKFKKRLNNVSKKIKIRNNYNKSYFYMNKFYNYFLKQPKINKCYFCKKYIDKNLNKEKTIKIKNEDEIININEIMEDKKNKDKNMNLSIEKIDKNELINEDNNKVNSKINNDEEKINESSQNGLLMTFGEVNYTKKNSDRINTTNCKNNDMVQLTNDIINDESDLDIYKKLNIIQHGQEQEMKNEDNISENEDIKLYFSDEDDIGIGTEKNSNPLYNSNKINNELFLFYESTNGKEIEDINKKVCKTFKKTNKGNKYNLENAEKGLRILKKIVVRRGYKSDDEQINKNINVDADENNHKIYLGTNKLNELFNNRKERELSYNKKNNSYNIKYRNKYSRSVNKDILKGINKMENFFERKYFNDNTKINTYEGKNNNFNRDYDFNDDNSCNIDNIIDYDEEIKPKIRTYIQKSNNLYLSNIKSGKDLNDRILCHNMDDDYVNLVEMKNNSFKKNMENNFKENNNVNEVNKENKIVSNYNRNEVGIKKESEKNTISLKENLLNEFNQEYKEEKINNNQNTANINKNNSIKEENNIIVNENKTKDKVIILEKNSYLENITEYQSNNQIKHELIYLLNILTEDNYPDILNKITNIILYQNNNINNNEIIIKNEHIFKDIIFKKTLEIFYIYLYAKLCYDLNNNISNALIEQKNIKNNKERNLKFIINEECIIFVNKYKKISLDYNYIIDKKSDEYILLKNKIIGYVIFVFELIDLELLKQQFGFYILEQFYKKYIDNEVKVLFKDIYLEACIVLLNKLGKNIFEKNNKKLIQNLNNFIKNNISNLINKDENKNNNEIPNYLKYKIINIIKKSENSWKDSLFELWHKEKNKIYFYENELKQEKSKEIIPKSSNIIGMNQDLKKEEKKTIESKRYIIEEDLKNYISYFSEQGNKGEINIKNNVDKSYNWKAIDELINEKNFGLEYIINQFIEICSNIIHEENQLVIANDYIKNIIEYYSNNLQKNIIDSIHNEMIKTFLNVNDYIKNNYLMSKILGNLLFILIENRLYHIKDFNNYLKAEKQTQINLAIITKYCIISSGKFTKKYFNDFKQTKLFINNNIFKQYVTDALKDLFYFIK